MTKPFRKCLTLGKLNGLLSLGRLGELSGEAARKVKMKSTFCGKTKHGTVTAIVATLALTSLLIGAVAANTESIIDDLTPTTATTSILSEMGLAGKNSGCLAERGDSGGLSYMNLDLTNTVTPTPAPSFIWLPLVVKNYRTDTYEPNNSPDDAYALVSGTTYYSYIWCPNDDDWYYIISTLNTITIHLYVPSVADYDLYLYDSTMTFVASSGSYGNGVDEHIEYKPDQAGKYYIRVYPYEGCCSNTDAYSLVGTFTAPPTPTPTLTSTPTPTLIHTLTHTPTSTSSPTPTHTPTFTPTPTLSPTPTDTPITDTPTPTLTSTPTPTSFPISIAPGDQSAPAIAYNNNEYMVVWQDARTPTGFDIYGQRVSSTGDLLDNPASPQNERTPTVNFAISTRQGEQQCPAVAYNTNTDQYLVIWQDYRNSGTVTPTPISWDIYGQVISSTGELIDPTGTPGPIDPSNNFPIVGGEGAQCYPDVSYSSNTREYLVVWQEDGDTAFRIYGRRLRGSRPRGKIGSPFPIPTYTSNDQESPAIAYDSCRDEYLVVWQENRTGTGWDIYGQWIPSHCSGSPYKSFAICTVGDGQPCPDNQIRPSVAYNNTAREYLVVWQDARNNPNYSIYGQRVSETGGLLGSDFLISAPTEWNWNSSVACNSSANEYLVVWQGYPTESYKWAIYGQWISREGELKGENFRISINSNDPLPDVGYSNSAEKYLVVWSHEGNIYGQLVGPGPTPTMTPTPVWPFITFDKDVYYTTGDTATITVVDHNCNCNVGERETIDVEVKSDSCPLGICICLTETSDNSGRFTSTTALQFSTDLCEDSSDTIQVADGDKITAKHHADSYIKTDEAFWYEVAPTPTPTCIASWMSTQP
jgi:hypothetical protein